jgi:hypothetical protein
MYTLQDLPGKGKGLVANRNIPKGTRILEERPIIRIPEHREIDEGLNANIVQQVESLNEHQQQCFCSLYNLYPCENAAEMYLGIVRTNALPIEADGVGGGIFLEACRINHACNNNAQKYWNKRTKRHTVHALRNISKGEEITIYYPSLKSSREVRRQKLKAKFGFLCSCLWCSLEPAESQKNDRRLARIDQLDDLVGAECTRENFSPQTFRYVDERVGLINEQGGTEPLLPRAYLDAAQVAVANGNLARGSVFTKMAVEEWRIAQGSDSDDVVKYELFIRDLTKFGLYGISMRWKTSLEESQPQPGSDTFDDWLWRRKKPERMRPTGQLTSLLNREIFPSFEDLPHTSKLEATSSQSLEDPSGPSHHWCLLAEITGSMIIHHLEFELVDMDRQTFPLHFYTEGRGNELERKSIREGYTVAVLYARRRAFVHGDPGVDHVDPRMLKVRKRCLCLR